MLEPGGGGFEVLRVGEVVLQGGKGDVVLADGVYVGHDLVVGVGVVYVFDSFSGEPVVGLAPRILAFFKDFDVAADALTGKFDAFDGGGGDGGDVDVEEGVLR